jgi:PAS domain S-box-containing protein
MSIDRWLNRLRLADPVEQKLAYLLQLIFIALTVGAIADIFVNIIFMDGGVLRLTSLAPNIVLFITAIGGIWLLRNRQFKVALGLLVACILAAQTYYFLTVSLTGNNRILLISAIPVTITGLLISRRALLLVTAFSVALVLGFTLREQGTIFTPTVGVFIPILAMLSFLVDIFGSTLRRELAASTQRAAQLEQAQQTLEQRALENARLGERLEVTLQSIGEAVISTDDRGRVERMNQTAEALTGWKSSEAKGHPLADVFHIIHERTREPLEDPAARVMREDKALELDGYSLLIAKDGREIPVADSGAPIRGNDGRILGVVLVFRDITKARQMERQSALLYQAEQQARDEAERTARRLLQIQKLTSALSAAATYQEVADVVIRQGFGVLGSQVGSIFLLSPDGKTLSLLTEHGFPEDVVAQYTTLRLDSHLPIADAVRSGSPIWLENAETYRESYLELAEKTLPLTRTQSLACLPMVVNGRPIGGIGVTFAEERRFAPDDQNFLLTLADQCGQALERARLYEQEAAARREAEEIADQMRRLQTVTVALSSALTIRQVGQIIVEQGAAVLGAVTGTFQILDEKGTSVEMVHLMGGKLAEDERAKWRRYPLEPGLPATQVVQTRQALWFSSADDVARDFPAIAHLAKAFPGASAIIPVVVGSEVVAVFSYAFATHRVFTAKEQGFILLLAERCAQALERARLIEQAQVAAALEERQRLARDLHDAVSQTLFTANVMAEALPRLMDKDPEKGKQSSNQLAQVTRSALAEMRTLLLELRPATILNNNLSDLLNQLKAAIQGKRNISITMAIHEEGKLPSDVHIAFYRIVQEALNNIVKHAGAQQVEVTLICSPTSAQLRVKDDGAGFDPHSEKAGLGLGMMQERAQSIGATLDIYSAPQQGTRIDVTWNSKEESG